MQIMNFFKNEVSYTMVFLILSAISLVGSFFDIRVFGADVAWIAIVLCGFPIIKDAAIGLITEFDIKADVLVAMALIASVIIGEIFAAGEVAFIMVLGALLEERTVAKARAGIEKLVNLRPATARVIRHDLESIIPAQDVVVGDTLRVLAGETIAVDGLIVFGESAIDQSIMTGESLPVDKDLGDEVFSGTVNQFGTFDMKATKVGADSSLQKMISLVESADASKAKIVGVADRWATWIVIAAVLCAIGTWFVTGEIIRSVTILVVFCPCALVLATPTAIMASIGNASKFGILIREGDALERLSKVRIMAFDKTGTLTYGKPDVVAVHSVKPNLSKEELFALTAAAELRSEHPLGKAIVAHFKNKIEKTLQDPTDFSMITGRGVKAIVENKAILAGNLHLLNEHEISVSAALLDMAEVYSTEGCTIIYIGIDNLEAGFVALADTLRKDSAALIQELKTLHIESLLLTGDNPLTASHIAKHVGITDVCSQCMPEDKLCHIDQHQNKKEMVCMIGDGINDAPALKQAYVGVAMGGIGSDIAVDAADITLVHDDIKCIIHLVRLSQKTMKTIKLNLTFSMILNFIAVVLAMTGILNPVFGALIHNVGSVVVIVNSALLLNFNVKNIREKNLIEDMNLQ